MSTPAIVLKSQFVYGTNDSNFTGYLNYIDRDDAKLPSNHQQVKYNNYLDYMGDGAKLGYLFNDQDDSISNKQLQEINNLYDQAQQNRSPMWKDVLSFDNKWLEKQGLYNSKTNFLNENKMKNAVRDAIDIMCEKEGMQMPIWTASFHYNTDNIHVHIATVDLDPSHLPLVQAKDTKKNKLLYDEYDQPIMQYRGKRKPKTLDQMKSAVVNHLVDRSKAYKRIDELIRDNARRIREIEVHKGIKDDRIQTLFDKALDRMPRDKKMWKYGYYSIDEARSYIDEIGEYFVDTYFQEDLQELHQELDAQVELNRELYGGSDYDDYKSNKLDDFYKRVGNAVISVMKEYDKNQSHNFDYSYAKKTNDKRIKNARYHYDFKQFKNISREFNQIIYLMKKATYKTFQDHKVERDIAEFDRMMDGYER